MRDVLSEAELKALLGEAGLGASSVGTAASGLEPDDKQLLQALARNQLRLMQMVEELQAELRLLKAVASIRSGDASGSTFPSGAASQQAAVSLEPLPLPFLKSSGTPAGTDETREEPHTPTPELSRKERFKRKTLKSFW